MKTGFILTCLVLVSSIQVSRGQANAGNGIPGLLQSPIACNATGWASLLTIGTSTSGDTLLKFDDGSAETGWGISQGKKGWLGNYFPVSPTLTGHIDTVYIWMLNNPGGTSPVLKVDVFDSSRVLKGSTSTFTATLGSWISVPAPAIPFTGPFYIMLNWDHFPGPSHWLGYDYNGSYASQNYERYCDSAGNWSNLVIAGGALPGVFLLRARASYNDLGIEGFTDQELPLVYPNPTRDRVIVSDLDGITSVKISTITGSERMEFHYSGLEKVSLDISSFPEGIYLLSIRTLKTASTSRLIIRR
jgi:hypothetical protein